MEHTLINRAALLLRYKASAVRWINEADPDSSDGLTTIEDVNDERTVYLIDDSAGADPIGLERWLERNFEALFEMELEGWYIDSALWPQDRTYRLFREWFEPEVNTVIIDTCSHELFDDDA
jgi:hypothetical protein